MLATINTSLVRPFALFARMVDHDLADTLLTATSRRYSKGTSVFEQGQFADHFYVLLHGRLRSSQTSSSGEQTIVRMVNPGDLFGITKALRRTDYPGTASAVMESVALRWPMASWDMLLERHPILAVNAVKIIGQRLQEALAKVRELSTEAVERRVAHTVLRLASQSGKKEAGGIRIDFPVTKQDIAEMTGTTLHTVSRILTAWEAADLVQGGRQKLLVKDPHRLLLIGDGAVPGLL